MAVTMQITWRGAAVLQHVRNAEVAGAKHVADDCVAMAKTIVNVATGELRDSIEAHEPVKQGSRLALEWGSFTIYYAIWQELNHKPYLRPSADACYPRLARYIREAM